MSGIYGIYGIYVFICTDVCMYMSSKFQWEIPVAEEEGNVFLTVCDLH